ncbi:family 2 encapsulin nanocompartment cargo protein terpene cyclase [Actinosynnema sp. NPDC047251]|uniref:family 2 encapsulin nanocompartment cargo protein terpene cyclase n=1 Tax=Saccharothrix espanaensis TaxID=103731 RepID=UPI0022B23412|nr:family 2 encapsulin nanocompartment cargo protein terpene cyclase [Saccharothrix espanaensis]
MAGRAFGLPGSSTVTDTAPAAQATATADWTTPTGLGTSAARVANQFTRFRPEPPSAPPAPAPAPAPRQAPTPGAFVPATIPGITAPLPTTAALAGTAPTATTTTPATTAPTTTASPAAPPGKGGFVPARIPGITAPLPGLPTAHDVATLSVPLPGVVHDPAYAEREWGDGTHPPLYVPVVERQDEVLTTAVEDGLVAWAADCGFVGEELDMLRAAGFGRLAVLTHTDSDDPQHLLIAAKLNAAWWAADDLYADSSELGATPTELPPRLALAMAAMDPLPDAGEFTGPLDEALAAEPVLVALRTGIDHLARYGTPAQVQRVNFSTFAMFVSWNAYAAWRHTGEYPPAWKYLATRQHDTFSTSMTVIDPVGGYEVPANLYYDPRVRRAAFQAGTASVLVNDLLSVAKDAADENPVVNMVLQIAADRQCPIAEATETVVHLHNRFVRDFEAGHRELLAVPSPELQRFLRGLRSWMGGGFEWHNTNPRYRV